jgi:hypothetical protein
MTRDRETPTTVVWWGVACRGRVRSSWGRTSAGNRPLEPDGQAWLAGSPVSSRRVGLRCRRSDPAPE